MLLSEIDLLQKSLFKVSASENFESTLKKDVRARVALAIEQSMKDTSPEVFLAGLRNAIGKLKYLNLTVAFEPNLDTVGRLYAWVKQNIGDGVVIDFTINKSILGGAIVEYKGKIKNLTILSKIEDYFLNNVNF